MKLYYVYFVASRTRVIYIGIISNLEKRLADHRSGKYPSSFAFQYKCFSLVYYEEFTRSVDAIARETQLKAWRRSKKVRLIESLNPDWRDLAPPFRPGSSLRSE